MDERCVSLLRQLISDLEGAPFPGTINNDLYTIWYEHVQASASAALEYMNESLPETLRETGTEFEP